MTGNATVIWVNRVDNRFDCKVIRTSPGQGTLEVYLDKNVLAKKEVTIAYDAKFGPDAEDVDDWCDFCITTVDKYLKENKSTASS